jgi:hypothetical protein
MRPVTRKIDMNAEETCRFAAELAEEYGESALCVAGRAVASFEADGLPERAHLWRALHAILGDIALRRLDPHAPLAIH